MAGAAPVSRGRTISTPVLSPARFEAEHRVLIGAVTTAARAGCDACAWQLAWALDDFLELAGRLALC
jgi:hypothetical protein